LALFLDVRTLEDVRGARGHGKQAFQRRTEAALAFLVLFDPGRDLGLPYRIFRVAAMVSWRQVTTPA
jgi:hypothetical protein